jgi:hypothetical protein
LPAPAATTCLLVAPAPCPVGKLTVGQRVTSAVTAVRLDGEKLTAHARVHAGLRRARPASR